MNPKEKEVRGFLVTGCNNCSFADADTGEYDTINYYYCKLYKKEFPNPKWNPKFMSGTRNSIPTGFPKFCRLKPISDQNAKVYQRYIKLRVKIREMIDIIEER